MSDDKPTICVDFDGVIHSYTSGWKGAAVIPDRPVPGAREAIEVLRLMGYAVKVSSARSGQLGGIEAVRAYLVTHGIEVDEVCEHKPPAIIYLDDRGVQFHGDWQRALKDIEAFECWVDVAKARLRGEGGE